MWALASSKPIFVLFVIDKRFTEAVNDTKGDTGFEQQARIRPPVMLSCLFSFYLLQRW